jgi:CHASE2 domain-containing sensor protein
VNGPETPPEPRWLFYILSFFIPLAGIILGAIYMSKPGPAMKQFGKTCLICALVCIGLICLCYILYFVGVLSLIGVGALSGAMH